MWPYAIWPDVLRNCYILIFSGLEISNLTLPRNVRIRFSSDVTSHFKWRQFSTTQLRKFQILIGNIKRRMEWDCIFPEAMTRSHIVCSTTCLPNTALIFRYLFASVRIEVNNARYCVNGHRSEKGGHIFTSVLFPLFCIGLCKIYSESLMCEFVKVVHEFCGHRRWRGCRLWLILKCFCRLHDRTKLVNE